MCTIILILHDITKTLKIQKKLTMMSFVLIFGIISGLLFVVMGHVSFQKPFRKENDYYIGIVYININNFVSTCAFPWIDEGEKDMFVDYLVDQVPFFNNTFDIVIDRYNNYETEFHCHECKSLLNNNNITGGIKYIHIGSKAKYNKIDETKILISMFNSIYKNNIGGGIQYIHIGSKAKYNKIDEIDETEIFISMFNSINKNGNKYVITKLDHSLTDDWGPYITAPAKHYGNVDFGMIETKYLNELHRTVYKHVIYIDKNIHSFDKFVNRLNKMEDEIKAYSN